MLKVEDADGALLSIISLAHDFALAAVVETRVPINIATIWGQQ
jgi:hypothetical protein